MRLDERPQWRPVCDWCGIVVGSWWPDRKRVLRILADHRRIHRQQGRMGQSIAAKDWP